MSFFIERPGSVFSPRLSYGRHRGPARVDCRRAAVIVALYPQRESGEWCLTLTRRPITLSHHGGQVCLPGGRIEPNESSLQAALREYREELGVELQVQQVIGRLRPIYVFASDNRVETWVVVAKTPAESWRPDPVEVDQVIEIPVSVLSAAWRQPASVHEPPDGCNESPGFCIRKNSVRVGKACSPGQVYPSEQDAKISTAGRPFSYGFSYQAIRFTDCARQQVEVWGATAMLLGEFAQRLEKSIADPTRVQN